VVNRHHGDLRVLRSVPGDTCLQVRLPLVAQEGEEVTGGGATGT
jgi:hypothetical protein